MSDEMPIENPKNCLECGQPLGAGRSDRKYCDDVCRTAYNNRRRNDSVAEPAGPYEQNPEFEKVFNILLANRETLRMHYYYKQETMLRDLLGKGFNLKYFTSENTIADLVFKFCFDYGYHVTENGRVYIEERPEEIFC